jgi:hypothetical protein
LVAVAVAVVGAAALTMGQHHTTVVTKATVPTSAVEAVVGNNCDNDNDSSGVDGGGDDGGCGDGEWDGGSSGNGNINSSGKGT